MDSAIHHGRRGVFPNDLLACFSWLVLVTTWVPTSDVLLANPLTSSVTSYSLGLGSATPKIDIHLICVAWTHRQTKRPQDLLPAASVSSAFRWPVTWCHLPRQGPQGDTCVGGRGKMYPRTARHTTTAGDYSPTVRSPAVLVQLGSGYPRSRLLRVTLSVGKLPFQYRVCQERKMQKAEKTKNIILWRNWGN